MSGQLDSVQVYEGGALRPKSLDYIAEQIRLLAEFNLTSLAVERFEVVVRDGRRVLTKREKPLRIYSEESKYFTTAGDTRLPSERFSARRRASRFNDEHRATAVSTVAWKETI